MWGLKDKRFWATLSPVLAPSGFRLRGRHRCISDSSADQSCDKCSDGRTRLMNAGCTCDRCFRKPRRLQRSTVPAAVVNPGAASPRASRCDPSPFRSSDEEDIAVDLDYLPTLQPVQEALCIAAPILVTLLMFLATRSWHGGSWVAKLAGVVAAAAMASLMRTSWLERSYKARERAHVTLGDTDSRFRPIATTPTTRFTAEATAMGAAAAAGTAGESPREGTGTRPPGSQGSSRHPPHHRQLMVHVKVKVGDRAARGQQHREQCFNCGKTINNDEQASGDVARPTSIHAVHCYHGFGANLGSYKRVQTQLAEVLRGVVTAHDMPGFGLTQRPLDMPSYNLEFNGHLGRLVQDYELGQLGLQHSPSNFPGQPGGRSGPGSGAAAVLRGPQSPREREIGTGSGSSGGEAVVMTVHDSAPPGGEADMTARGAEARVGTTTAAAAAAVAGGNPGAQRSQGPAAMAGGPLPVVHRILLGHSLGGACAALEAISDPNELAGLVLVAPAIVALPGPEYQQIALTPTRPTGGSFTHCGGSPAASLPPLPGAEPTSPQESRGISPYGNRQTTATHHASTSAAARAAAQLGPEPPGMHVVDPPVVRRLYPVGPTAAWGPSPRTGRAWRSSGWGQMVRRALSVLAAAVSLTMLAVLQLLTPLITLLLRSLVRRRLFWVKGLQQAYYNPTGVTDDIVDAYRLPQLVQGWEAGMVNFLLARVAGTRNGLYQGRAASQQAPRAAATHGPTTAVIQPTTPAAATASEPRVSPSPPLDDLEPVAAISPDKEPASDLASRLSALVAARQLPVLIIHGLYDRLVPASNSQRLARMLPGCELVLLDRCGHMPQEEMPELFVDLVSEFATRIGGAGGEEVAMVDTC